MQCFREGITSKLHLNMLIKKMLLLILSSICPDFYVFNMTLLSILQDFHTHKQCILIIFSPHSSS